MHFVKKRKHIPETFRRKEIENEKNFSAVEDQKSA